MRRQPRVSVPNWPVSRPTIVSALGIGTEEPVRAAEQTVVEGGASLEPVIGAAITDLEAGGAVADQRPREPVGDRALGRRVVVVNFGGQQVKASAGYCNSHTFR